MPILTEFWKVSDDKPGYFLTGLKIINYNFLHKCLLFLNVLCCHRYCIYYKI